MNVKERSGLGGTSARILSRYALGITVMESSL